MKKYIKVSETDRTLFNNKTTFCVGTGRINLGLRHEYHKQLEQVQKGIGFSYIRGHGLFCDDMDVYHTYVENGVKKVEYNFTYIDMVFDDYLSLGIKPFVELGFMPTKLASGDQTVFYWKGNVTPPSDYEKWADLIKATVNHWISRYGIDEVMSWPMEVWNEPNLSGFWRYADMDEYFKLYDVTSRAVKECDPRIRVGGPSICGIDDERWLKCFLEFCSENKSPLDFVTRHAYATEQPEPDGRYIYQKLRKPEDFMSELWTSRQIIDSFPEYKDMDMHITEFNTSYSPINPIHDTNLNAAYIARLLSEMGDMCVSYSYWTFGDVFEESGIAFTPFSGSFGLIANGGIPKPTYWAFKFFKMLEGEAISRDAHYVLTRDSQGVIHGVAWNPVEEPGNQNITFNFKIALDNSEYMLVTKLVDEETCNPLKSWIDMGSPANPSQAQKELLRELAVPEVSTKRLSINTGTAEFELNLKANALCYFSLCRVISTTDRGYSPERIRGAAVK